MTPEKRGSPMCPKHTTRNSVTPDGKEPIYHVLLTRERSLALRLEPGSRPTPLYRLSLWTSSGLVAGGFGGTTTDIIEILLALGQLGQRVDQEGFPGE